MNKYTKILLLLAISALFLFSCDERTTEVPSYKMTMSVSPDTIYADNNSTFSVIRVIVKDDDDFPVTNKRVTFSSSIGNIIYSINTDSLGIAETNFWDNGDLGVATITAYVGNTSKQVQVTILEPPAVPDYKLTMTAMPDTIYADNNLTYSMIQVVVKDNEDFAVPNTQVTFSSDIGLINYAMTTDSLGIVQTKFKDGGEEGLATIKAFVGSVAEQVQVTINEPPEIENLVLQINSSDLNIDDVITVKATAYNTAGYVPDGTTIIFETDLGYFEDEQEESLGNIVMQNTNNGVSTVNFNAGTQTGTATILARLSDMSEQNQITIHPGNPRFLYLTPEDDEVEANSGEQINITAQVEDKYHNAVEQGTTVEFTTTLGSIDQYDDTDDMGVAETTFSPGVTAGSAQITATIDSVSTSTNINVTSNDVNSIEFAFSGQVDLQVQGTGGQESYELKVYLYDMNGNLIDDSQTVWFELLNYPAGTNINNHGTIDSTQSVNGEAIVSINSGTESGIIRVKAKTYNEEDTEISATKSNIVVHSGFPQYVDFSIAGHSSGQNMGAGEWKVQVAALLTDNYGNPVSTGTAVFFSLPNNPEFASIEPSAFVGNENTDGDTLAGTAYTYLTYHGTHTNETITVELDVGEIDFNGNLMLPIQDPWIDIGVTPNHIDWNESSPNNPPDDQSAIVRITVKDGQNNPIDSQPLLFSSTLGDMIDGGTDNDNDEYTEITGVINDEHGRVNKEVEFHRYECPPPSAAGPGSTTATITVQILGTNTDASIDVILIRYAEMKK